MAVFFVFAFLSWFIGYNQEDEWVRRVFAPDYEPALAIIEEMLYTDSPIDSSDPNFEMLLAFFEESFLLRPDFQSDTPLDLITEIRFEDGVFFEWADDDGEPIITIQSYYQGKTVGEPTYGIQGYYKGKTVGRGVSMTEASIRDNLREILLEEPLWTGRFAIFSIGVVLSFGFLYYSWILPGESATKEVGKDFILFWILAAVTGFFLGTILSISLNIYLRWIPTVITILMLQWLIIRTQILRAWLWILANTIGFVSVYMWQILLLEYVIEKYQDRIMINGSYDVFLTGIQLLSILLIAVAQLLVLKRYFFRSGWWVLIGTVAYLISEKVYTISDGVFPIPGEPYLDIAAGLFSHATEAIILGIALYWLLKNHRREALAV